MNKYIKPFLTILVFLLPQAIAGLLIAMVNRVWHVEQTTTVLALSIIISNIFAVGMCYNPLGLLRIPKCFDVCEVKWNRTLTAIIGSVAGVLALNLYTEFLNLPNLMEQEFEGMIHNVYGVLAITIVAPVAEEVLFRESLLGGMLRGGVKPWKAILISSLAFGILHINPAQMLGAFGIGILLAIVYWRTGNAVLPILLHMLNNTFSVVQAWYLGDAVKEFSLTQYLGGTWPAIVCALCCTVACVYLFRHFLTHYPLHEGPTSAFVSDAENTSE